MLQKKSKALIDNSSTEESSAEDEENSGNEEADISEDSNALITELYELERKKFATFLILSLTLIRKAEAQAPQDSHK